MCSELFPNFLTFCKGIFVISINMHSTEFERIYAMEEFQD
jgi:hypothetical protein